MNREKERTKNSDCPKSDLNRELGKAGVMAAMGQAITKRDKVAEARNDIKYWANEYRSAEQAFAKLDDKEHISLKEYRKWESDVAGSFLNIKKHEVKAQFKDIYERNLSEEIAAVPGQDSIEAYAGLFYAERNNSLISAINTNTDDKKKQKDLDTVGSLFYFVNRHIASSKDYELARTSPEVYQKRRQDAHNNLINHFNQINHLADEYGVERLTCRDFETNDFFYDKRADWRGATDRRAEYDRSTVEKYMRLAFSRDYKDAEWSNNSSSSIVRQFHD